MPTVLDPDAIVRLRLLSTAEGGRRDPITVDKFGCPFYFKGEAFDCRLLLDKVPRPVAPGQTIEVPIKFLFPDNIKPRLRPGDKFKLWESRDIAEGEVLRIC